MNEYTRIAQSNNIVKVITTENEEFIGTLSPNYFIVNENGQLSVEIFISQTKDHTGKDFGCACLPLSMIKEIIPISS